MTASISNARSFIYLNAFSTRFLRHPERTVQYTNGQPNKRDGSLSHIPFNFFTPDNVPIFAWFILPHVTQLFDSDQLLASEIDQVLKDCSLLPVEDRSNFDSLARCIARLKQSNALLIITFHGNAGCVAETHRGAHYRALIEQSRTDRPVCVLAIDYRGFGISGGSPNEEGLIVDGISTVKHALDTLKFPKDKILLVGHSLGTAVASAVYSDFMLTGTRLAGLVLISGFASLPKLVALKSWERVRIWFWPM